MSLIVGDQVVSWVAQHMRRGEGYGLSQGIGWLKNGCIVAGVVYNEYNRVNINMHVASVGRNWLCREFLWAAFDYPFNQCGVSRITAFVEDDNKAALKFDEHLGFKYEARMVGAYEHDGKVGDILILRMLRTDCKWLNMRPKASRRNRDERFAISTPSA